MFDDLNRVPDFLPQGAIDQGNGKFTFRIWAPKVEGLKLIASPDESPRELPLVAKENGYYECELPGDEVAEGTRYAYRFPDGRTLPDPASRWQPDDVHKPSAVVRTNQFQWTDSDWRGIERGQLVIYELHIGTFTPEGTFDAAIGRLGELADLGITAIEVMPIAQFPGGRNWGYDGVYPYAAQNTYGGPQGFARLVDAAHRKGLAVLLDVVYNHLGPEGNYLAEFGPYFTDKYHTPWGKALNYDGRDCEPVRRFAIDNALMWIKEFHVDGLRMDACQFILDEGAEHILAELQRNVQTAAANLGRRVIVIAETDQNDPKLTNPAERGGFGLDGAWSDCFHHAVHCYLTGEHDGWYADFGRAEHVAKAFAETFCHDGGWSKFRRRRHGKKLPLCDRSPFVQCIQNHDQVGNRAAGDRLSTLVPFDALKLAAALLLTSPGTPLLYMGEEYAETRPFPFFCSFPDPELTEAVRKGRKAEFKDLMFDWKVEIPDPPAVETFESAKLSWSWPEGTNQGWTRALYKDLLTARREWPAFLDREHTSATIARPSKETPVLVAKRGKDPQCLIVANLSDQVAEIPAKTSLEGAKLSTADAKYGGARDLSKPIENLLPYELLLVPVPSKKAEKLPAEARATT